MSSNIRPRRLSACCVATVAVFALLLPTLAPVAAPAAIQRPATRFRITLNGFTVNHESDDDILEGDGKRDEVYVRADVWEVGGGGEVLRYTYPRTPLYGDINNQTDPPRLRAGNAAGDMGGLGTGSKVPSAEPWRRAGEPSRDRLPLLLFEGDIPAEGKAVVVVPTIWEWDSRDASRSQLAWDGEMDKLYRFFKPRFAGLVTNQASATELTTQPIYFEALSGTRPIGIDAPGGIAARGIDGFSPLMLLFDNESANLQTYRSPSDLGLGIIAVNYRDPGGRGDYTLYLQIEALPDSATPPMKDKLTPPRKNP